MWFSITEDHLPVPFAATHAPLQVPCPLHALLAVPPAPCHGPYLLHAPPQRAVITVHTVSPHMPCCCAPYGCICHLAIPIAATHAAHFAATTTITAVIAPQQRDYHNHPD